MPLTCLFFHRCYIFSPYCPLCTTLCRLFFPLTVPAYKPKKYILHMLRTWDAEGNVSIKEVISFGVQEICLHLPPLLSYTTTGKINLQQEIINEEIMTKLSKSFVYNHCPCLLGFLFFHLMGHLMLMTYFKNSSSSHFLNLELQSVFFFF